MDTNSVLQNPHRFSEVLFERMVQVNPGLEALELYEFRYALDNITPEQGWASVQTESKDVIQNQISQKEFFTNIQLKASEE